MLYGKYPMMDDAAAVQGASEAYDTTTLMASEPHGFVLDEALDRVAYNTMNPTIENGGYINKVSAASNTFASQGATSTLNTPVPTDGVGKFTSTCDGEIGYAVKLPIPTIYNVADFGQVVRLSDYNEALLTVNKIRQKCATMETNLSNQIQQLSQSLKEERQKTKCLEQQYLKLQNHRKSTKDSEKNRPGGRNARSGRKRVRDKEEEIVELHRRQQYHQQGSHKKTIDSFDDEISEIGVNGTSNYGNVSQLVGAAETSQMSLAAGIACSQTQNAKEETDELYGYHPLSLQLQRLQQQNESRDGLLLDASTPSNLVFLTDLPDQSKKWDQRYHELVAFKEQHGHTNVPTQYSENKRLATWCIQQRTHHRFLRQGKQSSMTPMRIKKLDKIGFVWSTYGPSVSWETRYEQLKVYRNEHGHCNVPQRDPDRRDPTVPVGLGNWVTEQRRMHKGLICDTLTSKRTQDKIDLLDQLGFQWVLRKCKS